MAVARRYLIALGSNQRHARYGGPRAVLGSAIAAMGSFGSVEAVSPIVDSAPLGPSRRRYVNAAVVLASGLEPAAMLSRLQAIERGYGRVRRGQRWRARALDLDLIMWSGGAWDGPGLIIPHREFRRREFVLAPAAAIAARWRDPITKRTIAHLLARLTRPTPLP